MVNFFKRKTRNRRRNSGTMLDVKLRHDQVRSTRMRALAVGLGVTFGTLASFFLLWRAGEWTLNRLVYENEAFTIAALDVQTDGVIAPDQLRRWAGVKPGENLMSLDLGRVKRDLELVSAISAVTVERVLPRTLRLRVTERSPVAQVNVPRSRAGGGLDSAVVQLDGDGFVMQPLDPRQRATPIGQPEEPLPLLAGVNFAELQVGRRVESPQVQAALELLQKFRESPLGGLVDLKRVDVSSPEILVVTTGQGSAVTFGLADLDRQLLRWREIYERGLRSNKAIATLDLAVKNNIPATWLEASAVPAPVAPRKPARPVRPPTIRKRNV